MTFDKAEALEVSSKRKLGIFLKAIFFHTLFRFAEAVFPPKLLSVGKIFFSSCLTQNNVYIVTNR